MLTEQKPRQVTIEQFEASNKQQEFLNCTARHKALSGGFGSGKTTCNVVQGLAYALENPGSRGMWVSATYKLLGRSLLVEWDHWSRLVTNAVGQDIVSNFNRSEMRLQFVNGSVIWFGTANEPDSLYGTDLAWFGGDEIALWKKRAFDNMLDRLRQPGFEHKCWATYTPYGKGWWCDYFEDAGLANSELFRISSRDNPVTSQDYIDSLASRYTGKWALQYIEGVPQEFEGLIWGGLIGCDYGGDLPAKWKRIVGGVDWGWTNPSVLLLVGEDLDGRPWTFGEDWETMRHPEAMADAAVKLQEQYPVDTWYCDPSEPGNIATFRAKGLNAQKAENAVLPGIAAVDRAIADGMRVVDCPHLLAESYCWQQKADGTFAQDKPQKQDDHCADGLRYAIYSGFDQHQPQVRLTKRPTGM